MFILFILGVIAALAIPNGEPTAAAIFFSFGPIIYDLDYFIKNWWNYQKLWFFHKKHRFLL